MGADDCCWELDEVCDGFDWLEVNTESDNGCSRRLFTIDKA